MCGCSRFKEGAEKNQRMERDLKVKTLIVGLGLMGGSVGLDLRQAKSTPKSLVWICYLLTEKKHSSLV